MEAADSECWATNPEFLRILLEVACRHEVHLDGPIPRNQKWEAISAELKAIPQFADQALQLDGKVLRRKCNELKQQFESKHKDSIFSTTEHSTLAPQPADLVTSKHETIFLQMFEERKQQLQAAEKTKNQQKQETPPKFKETSTTESPNENDWNAAALISFFNIARKEKVHIAHGKKSRSAEEKWQQVRKQFAFALPAHSPLEHASETALQNKFIATCAEVNRKYRPAKGKQLPWMSEEDKVICAMIREGDAELLFIDETEQQLHRMHSSKGTVSQSKGKRKARHIAEDMDESLDDLIADYLRDQQQDELEGDNVLETVLSIDAADAKASVRNGSSEKMYWHEDDDVDEQQEAAGDKQQFRCTWLDSPVGDAMVLDDDEEDIVIERKPKLAALSTPAPAKPPPMVPKDTRRSDKENQTPSNVPGSPLPSVADSAKGSDTDSEFKQAQMVSRQLDILGRAAELSLQLQLQEVKLQRKKAGVEYLRLQDEEAALEKKLMHGKQARRK